MDYTFDDGRDEMNLADFPISVLQRAQRADAEGQKLDRMEFTASRYDPVKRQRVNQKVTLTSTARDGLPTPADEHVILALLHVAKHSNNFAEATVFFAPGQLFRIMGWAPNGRSYDRLRDVLRRLKSLTIRYANAWWDAVGRGYEEEVATGIVSGYRLARQVSGPRTNSTALRSWVIWTQQFHASLLAGNIKRLNLDIFFRLRTPTAQRMYRFLDKRFYSSPQLSMDLFEFACGHIGLTEVSNVAVLKRRLQPALDELEAIGFLQPLPAEQRFVKVKAGQWRITISAVPANGPTPTIPVELPQEETDPVVLLTRQFYRLWDPTLALQPGPRDCEQAQELLNRLGQDKAMAVIAILVQVTRKQWPECRSLSGSAQKYLGEAIQHFEKEERRRNQRLEAEQQREQERLDRQTREKEEQELNLRWEALTPDDQQMIRERVLANLAGRFAPEAFIRKLCLDQLGVQASKVN